MYFLLILINMGATQFPTLCSLENTVLSTNQIDVYNKKSELVCACFNFSFSEETLHDRTLINV